MPDFITLSWDFIKKVEVLAKNADIQISPELLAKFSGYNSINIQQAIFNVGVEYFVYVLSQPNLDRFDGDHSEFPKTELLSVTSVKVEAFDSQWLKYIFETVFAEDKTGSTDFTIEYDNVSDYLASGRNSVGLKINYIGAN